MGIEGAYLNIIKATNDKSTANLILDDEKLKAFPVKSGARRGKSTLSTIMQQCFESPSHGNQRRKRDKRNPNWKSNAVTVCRHDIITWRILKRPCKRAHQWNQHCCRIPKEYTEISCRASLVAQWLKIHVPMQGTQLCSLVWEDSICHGATKPTCQNYWSPSAHDKRRHRNEKPTHHKRRVCPRSPQLQKTHSQQQRSSTVKKTYISNSYILTMKDQKEKLRREFYLPLQQRIKHLRINLPKDVKELYSQNCKILVEETKGGTDKWRDIPRS